MFWRLSALCSLAAACSTSPPPSAERGEVAVGKVSTRARVGALRARENALRAHFAPSQQPVWIDVSGADPYRLIADGAAGFWGLLRGSKALVRLDSELREIARVALPEAPTSLCRSPRGDIWIASRYAPQLLKVRFGAASAIEKHAGSAAGVADIACANGGAVYVLSTDGSELLTLDAGGRVKGRRPALAGGLRLLARDQHLLEVSLFERSVRVLELDAQGVPTQELTRIQHDGAIWAVDALERDGELLVAVAGVEDRPLVRAHGEFENIDSFVWLYRWSRGGGLQQLAELNVSDAGVVVPKALKIRAEEGSVALGVLGSGSGRLLQITWPLDKRGAPVLETRAAPPGVSDAVFDERGGVVYASPLLDAWIQVDAAGVRSARPDPERRPDLAVRLGEALFFTELIAPENSSDGAHSRFTCETCHFEGGVDGRVHFTGRADVSVVTKPLFGLANNRPHFSRALDPDLSSVAHNEFRVAGAGSGTEAWFSLQTARFPWLRELGVDRAELGPLELREALLDFLYAFSHAPNPRAQGRAELSTRERAGARVFRDRCQSCHEPRLASDDPSTRVPFEAWPSWVLSRNAPLVWARGDYEQTGILPYVHERGTRIPSLRRLALKPRYFTNGSAPDLANVLERFRYGPEIALHEAAGRDELERLSPEARAALLAFLRLL